jgi:hypothetical protein
MQAFARIAAILASETILLPSSAEVLWRPALGLKHSLTPKISNTFDQQNVVKVVVCWDDARDILQLSVIG